MSDFLFTDDINMAPQFPGFATLQDTEEPMGAIEFPSAFADSPFGPGWDKPEIKEAGNVSNAAGTTYYCFLPYSDANQLYEDYLNRAALLNKYPFDILVLYTKNTTDELLIIINGKSYNNLINTARSDFWDPDEKNISFRERAINLISREKKEGYIFSKEAFTAGLDTAIDDYTFYKEHQSGYSNYTLSVAQMSDRIKKGEKGTKALLNSIYKAIAKMSAADRLTYNKWVQATANPDNYFLPISHQKDNFTAEDLQALLHQMEKITATVEEFQSGKADSVKKLMDLVNTRLTAGGGSAKWLITIPFFKLGKKERKKYIDLFADSDSAIFGRFSIGSEIGEGDVVLQLFAACSDENELIEIILQLESEGRLFKLLNNLKLSAFKDLAILIGNVYMEYHQKKDKNSAYVKFVENGHYLEFDNTTMGNANIEKFDTGKQKITFDTDINPIIKGLASTAENFDTYAEKIELKQPMIEVNPLDLIILTPTRDIKEDWIELKSGESYLLPACLVYVIYRQESISSVILGGLLTVQVALCLVGVGELVAALEAGSAFGIIWSGSSVAVDVAFTTIMLPEVQQDYPTYTKIVNYVVWAKIFMELAGVRNLEGQINSGLARIRKSVQDFIKKIPVSSKAAAFINLFGEGTQKYIVEGLLYIKYRNTILAKIDTSGIIKGLSVYRELEEGKMLLKWEKCQIRISFQSNGKAVSKTYTDTIEVYKTNYGVTKIRLAFNDGVKREARLINEIFERNGANPAYMTESLAKSFVEDGFFQVGEDVYVVENLTQAAPGGFLTDKPIYTEKELREKLAVLENWKNNNNVADPLVIRKYKIILGFERRKGYIGSMKETTAGSVNFGKTYPGGNLQYESLINFRGLSKIEGKPGWTKYMERDETFTKLLK
jgi:hypothetical protein